jgi:hypothetical protein
VFIDVTSVEGVVEERTDDQLAEGVGPDEDDNE